MSVGSNRAPVTDEPQPSRPQSLDDALSAAGICLRLQGRRAELLLDDAEHHNPQTPATWLALKHACTWLEDQADVVVIRGAGPSFSAGLDRRAFTPQGIDGQPGLFQLAMAPEAQLDEAIAEFQTGFSCWREARFLSIAAVQGHAIGAGFQLALATDLRIAADTAAFAMREPQLGLVPDLTGTHRLVEAVGYARAVQICATGRTVDAAEALQIGLVQHVVPADQLDDAVEQVVQAFQGGNADAVLATRALLRGALSNTTEEQFAAERAAQMLRLRAMAAAFGAQ